MREYTPAGHIPRPAGGLVTIDGARIVLPDTEHIRLWMIADADLWTLLQAAGELRVDPALISWDDFRPHYDWLRGQLIQRIPGYSGDYPWWSWATPKPDLRIRSMYHASPTGGAQVRLTLDVPTAEILAFDFQEWHIPLNNRYFGLTEAEDEAWYALPERERTRPALEASWERLFDPDLPRTPDWLGTPDRVQAVFETLRLADEARVKPFAARPAARWNTEREA